VTAGEAESSFFEDHGITPEVAGARPYIRWTLENVQPVRDGYAGLNQYQRAFMTRLAKQSHGRIISRRPPPGMGLEHIYPEIRPDNPVRTQPPTTHYHGDPQLAPDDLPAKRIYRPDGKAIANHIARKKAADDHHGVNTNEMHTHVHLAKYVFPPAPKKDEVYSHYHDRLRNRQEHVGRWHDGVDDPCEHDHTRRVKDRTINYARRIDVHPMAVDKIARADTVFFVIEGCINSDAVLSAGAAVFSVPSVTLWDCDELGSFVDKYLVGRTIVIVPDADWFTNPAVISQARICEATLLRYGVSYTHVAAPPVGGGHKGVDDHLAAGGLLEDLVTVDVEPPVGIREFMIDRCERMDQVSRNTDVLTSMALWAGDLGEIGLPLQTQAKIMGRDRSQVGRAVNDLLRVEAVTVDGSLALRRNYWSGRDEWKNMPTITIREELRALTRPHKRLGDVIEGTIYPDGG
jgi:hypothetical protein